jgi:hypothetical protein
MDPAPPLGNSMARFGNQGATRRHLPAAKDRKQPEARVAKIAAIADQTAKLPNSRKGPQSTQAFLSPETGVRIPVAVLALLA